MAVTKEVQIKEVVFITDSSEDRPPVIVVVGSTQTNVAQFYSRSNKAERYHAGIQRDNEYDCDTLQCAKDMARLLNFHAARGSLDTTRWDQIFAVYRPAIRKEVSFSLVQNAMKSQVDWS